LLLVSSQPDMSGQQRTKGNWAHRRHAREGKRNTVFRTLVHILPARIRRRILEVLPADLDRALRAGYYQEPWIRRLTVRLAADNVRRRHQALLALPDVHIHAVGRQALLCREAEQLTVDKVRQENLDLVTVLLDQLDVPYFLVKTEAVHRHCIAVESSQRERILRTLMEELRDQPVYVSAPREEGRDKSVLAADLRVGQFRSAPVVRVGQVFSSGQGRLVLGHMHACDIEFWDAGDGGALVAPRENSVASVLPPDARARATTLIGDRRYPTVEAFTKPTIGEVRFPVDVVYTWVDGEDPEWRRAKEHHQQLAGKGSWNVQAANSARFLSRDELMYSFRSLNLYADWVRTIYLVTAGQTPSWLDTSNPRIKLVTHADIFADARCLPTFNSHAIESRLHHIDGLSEHYLYLNDDVFFGRVVSPELFFHGNGLSMFFMSKAQLDLGPPDLVEPPVMSAAKNNRALIRESFGLNITQKLKHVPHAQQRSVLFEMEERFPDRFAQTSANRFRSHSDLSIASALHHYYAYATGRAVPGQIRYAYSDVSDPYTAKRLQKLLWARDSDVICLNDTDLDGVDADQKADLLRDFLEAYYPAPSAFERRKTTRAGSDGPEHPLRDTPQATPTLPSASGSGADEDLDVRPVAQ
jgi:hypothetical protein